MNNHVIYRIACETPLATVGHCSRSAYVYADLFSERTADDYSRTPTEMSTNPKTTTESQPTITPTTEIEARGDPDPWAAPDETPRMPSARTQRQFEPTCRKRLRNLTDRENAYCE